MFIVLSQSCFAIGSSHTLADEFEKDIYKLMDTYRVSGLSVSIVQDQDIILSRGFGISSEGKRLPLTSRSQAEMFSTTKVLTVLTILSLAERGLVDINAPLGDLLDDIPKAWESIPFWRLLNHTSGITTVVDKPEFEKLTGAPQSSDRDIFKIAKSYPLDYQPGQYSRYRQSGYGIAAMIVSEKLDMNWPDIVEKYVINPAGMENTVHWKVQEGSSKNPMLTSAGGYLTTPDDMAKLFRALNAGKIVSPATLRKEIFDPQRIVDGYSLGSILESYGDIRTLGHRGGGARANIRYAPEAKVGVAVFTDQQDNYELAIELADKTLRHLLLNQPLEKSRQPIAIRLADYREQPPETIISFYKNAKTRHRDKYNFAEAEMAINSLGYYLLGLGEVDSAIEIFKFNTREYPNSANTYDSLGEAYLADGDTEKARENYEKSLQLDPDNEHAVEMLRNIDQEGEVTSLDHTRNWFNLAISR